MSSLGGARRDVVAISIAGQQHGCVLLDATGEPVRPAKLWNDTTSAPQADQLVELLGADRWATATGSVPVASFTITKLAWLAEHEPDALARATRVMLPHDYLTWRLTGEHVTDRGDASGSGWFDPSHDAHVPDLLAAATGHWGGQVPRVLGPADTAGTLTPEAADALGLPAGIAVAPGSGDNMGAAMGLGLRAGDVAISLGTSGTVFAVSATPTADTSGAVAGFASATGSFLPLVCTLNATKVTDTVAGWLGTDAPGLAELALAAADRPGSAVLVPLLRRRAHAQSARRDRHAARPDHRDEPRADRTRRSRRCPLRSARRGRCASAGRRNGRRPGLPRRWWFAFGRVPATCRRPAGGAGHRAALRRDGRNRSGSSGRGGVHRRVGGGHRDAMGARRRRRGHAGA